MIKSFFLYVHERLEAIGVLTQLLGSWHFQVAYLSKQLDAFQRLATLPVCPGSYCHLGGSSRQTTLRQKLTVQVPHFVSHGI
jgi:hypothetical protein